MPKDNERSAGRCMGEVTPGIWIGSLASLSELQTVSSSTSQWTVISVLSSKRLTRLASDMVKTCQIIQQHVIWRLPDTVGADLLDEEELKKVLTFWTRVTTLVWCIVHKACLVPWRVCHVASRKQVSLKEALTMIRKVRPEVNPNLGFLASAASSGTMPRGYRTSAPTTDAVVGNIALFYSEACYSSLQTVAAT